MGSCKPQIFFPKDISVCSHELRPAWRCWQDRLRQGEELPVLPSGANTVALGPWCHTGGWQLFELAGSGLHHSIWSRFWQLLAAGEMEGSCGLCRPPGSCQPMGSRAGWHGQALPASCPSSPARLLGQSGRRRLIEQISRTQGWGA